MGRKCIQLFDLDYTYALERQDAGEKNYKRVGPYWENIKHISVEQFVSLINKLTFKLLIAGIPRSDKLLPVADVPPLLVRSD